LRNLQIAAVVPFECEIGSENSFLPTQHDLLRAAARRSELGNDQHLKLGLILCRNGLPAIARVPPARHQLLKPRALLRSKQAIRQERHGFFALLASCPLCLCG
jgi:hypothetical protein